MRYSIDSLEAQNSSNAENIIIFLSDGKPTTFEHAYEIPDEEFDYSLVDEAASKGIRIYTIGLTDEVNENILKEMARRTNGEYYFAASAIDLVEFFLNVNMEEKYDITTDLDEDGLPDLFEIYGIPIANGSVVYSDPSNLDSDGDGLIDGEEVIMHTVNDVDEFKEAYKYMYNYIPEVYISNNGGIYFTIKSNPQDSDTDGDLDLDDIDPNPLSRQLNGNFSKHFADLYNVAQIYLDDIYDNSERLSVNNPLWLASYYIRCFNENYATELWAILNGRNKAFLEFVNKNYPEIYLYFNNTSEIYATNNGQTLDLYHCYAALSAISRKSFYGI